MPCGGIGLGFVARTSLRAASRIGRRAYEASSTVSREEKHLQSRENDGRALAGTTRAWVGSPGTGKLPKLTGKLPKLVR